MHLQTARGRSPPRLLHNRTHKYGIIAQFICCILQCLDAKGQSQTNASLTDFQLQWAIQGFQPLEMVWPSMSSPQRSQHIEDRPWPDVTAQQSWNVENRWNRKMSLDMSVTIWRFAFWGLSTGRCIYEILPAAHHKSLDLQGWAMCKLNQIERCFLCFIIIFPYCASQCSRSGSSFLGTQPQAWCEWFQVLQLFFDRLSNDDFTLTYTLYIYI